MPTRVRIPHDPDPDGRFHYVGTTADGRQFMAFVTGAFPYDPVSRSQRFDGEKVWMAVVHLFGSDGTHLVTDTRLGASDVAGRLVAGEAAWAELQNLFSELDLKGASPGDIWVAPFQLLKDGILYGLVYEADEDDGDAYEHVMLEPNDVMLHPPWDSGTFST